MVNELPNIITLAAVRKVWGISEGTASVYSFIHCIIYLPKNAGWNEFQIYNPQAVTPFFHHHHHPPSTSGNFWSWGNVTSDLCRLDVMDRRETPPHTVRTHTLVLLLAPTQISLSDALPAPTLTYLQRLFCHLITLRSSKCTLSL